MFPSWGFQSLLQPSIEVDEVPVVDPISVHMQKIPSELLQVLGFKFMDGVAQADHHSAVAEYGYAPLDRFRYMRWNSFA
jgi:hypothetical protein